MNSPQTLNAYAKEHKERKSKHINPQQFHEPNSKEWHHMQDYSKKVKPKVDLEAILKLEDELWNS